MFIQLTKPNGTPFLLNFNHVISVEPFDSEIHILAFDARDGYAESVIYCDGGRNFPVRDSVSYISSTISKKGGVC